MIDVSPKFNTLRYAKAEGKLFASEKTLKKVKENKVPKGNIFEVARAAGIASAKRTPETIIFCHSIPIDWIEVDISVESNFIQVFCEVKSIWKTGVEMEALNGVSSALLNIYDMLKPLDKNIYMTDIKLTKKKGGKNDFDDVFETPLKAAVLVLSDSTFAGEREDKSGKIIKEFLIKKNINVEFYDILPDDIELIKNRLLEYVDKENLDLIITTGGTGLGPKDLTPEATKMVIEREVPGISEAIRKHGKDRTPFAMLSREIAGTYKNSLIINLPGSSKGARESMEALFPGILHSFSMIYGGKH